MEPTNSFPAEVQRQLGCYVYRLIDPRNGETFYVGKGTGNRVFEHVRGAQRDDESSLKLARIRSIHSQGLEVLHIIHRHGMDDSTAFQVEAALMDAYPGVANAVGGVGSVDFGPINATQAIDRYGAEEAILKHRCLAILLRPEREAEDLLEATRWSWRLDPERARKAEFVLAIVNGLIAGVFVATEWFQTPDGRWAFEGGEANTEIVNMYRGRRFPDRYRKRGAANPVRYCE